MPQLTILGSSSSGNGYILSAGSQVLVLEAGVPMKMVKEAVDFNLSRIASCIISHSHADHAGRAHEYLKAGVKVYATMGTAKACGFADHHRFFPLQYLKQVRIGNFTCLPFEIVHDCEEPAGFLIGHAELGTLVFMTDSAYSPFVFPAACHFLLEANHSREIVTANVESGKISSALASRVISNHLSIESALDILRIADKSRLRSVTLAHLSNLNSDADAFRRHAEMVCGIPVRIAETGMSINL